MLSNKVPVMEVYLPKLVLFMQHMIREFTKLILGAKDAGSKKASYPPMERIWLLIIEAKDIAGFKSLEEISALSMLF